MAQLECILLIQIVMIFSKIQQLYLGEDEYHHFSRQAIVIQTNQTKIEEEKFSNIQYLIDNREMVSEQLSNIYANLTIQSGYSIVMTSILYDKSAIDICFSKTGSIYCKYRVMNKILNNDLLVINSYNYSLQTNNTFCEQIYSVQINQFIIQCQSLEGLMIMLINNQSQVIDSVTIKSIYNQSQKSISKDQYIIIYESFDSLCSLFIIKWSIDSNVLQYEQIIINGQDHSDSDLVGVINNIQFYDNNSLQICFSYLILNFNLINKSKTSIYVSNRKDVQYFQLIKLNQVYSEMVVYLDHNIKNIYEICNKEFLINPQFSKLEQVQYINQNMIIKFESLLYIVNNQYVYKVRQVKGDQVIFLEDLPFVLLFSKSEKLQILKINSFPSYFKYSTSQYMSVFWCVYMDLHVMATIYKMNHMPQNCTTIIENDKVRVKVLLPSQFNYNYIYKHKTFGLPFQVNTYTEFNGFVENISESKILYSNLDKNTIILINNQIDSFVKLIFYKNQTFHLYDQTNKIYRQHYYPFNFNESQIIISKSQSSFIVVEQSKLYYYLYESSQIKTLNINFQKKINYFVQIQDQVQFYLEDCTLAITDLLTFKLNEINQTHQLNCTLNFPEQDLMIKFKPQLIDFLRQSSYSYSISFNNIVRLQNFVNYKKVIIFELIESRILLKLYHDKIYNYQYQFEFPTYSFTIDYPLQYRIYQSKIAILAHNESMDQFILIYDVNLKKLNSMIKFIQVDQGCRIFYFYSISTFYYVYQNQLRIISLDQMIINFKSDIFKNKIDSYSLETEIKFFLDPRFTLNNDSLTLLVTALNLDQKLQLLTQNSLSYYIQDKQKVIPVNQITGIIESVIYINEVENKSLSSFILVDKIKCSMFEYKACIQDNNKIILDAFNIQLALNFNNSKIIQRFSLFQFEEDIFIYILDENKILSVSTYTLQGNLVNSNVIEIIGISLDNFVQNQIQVIGDFVIFTDINRQVKTLFIVINHKLQQFQLNGSNQFEFISIIKTSNQYYFSFYCFNQPNDLEFINFMILNFKFDIIAQAKISLNNLLQTFEDQILRLSITEFVINNDYLRIKLLICSNTLQCHYFQLKYDLQLNLLGTNIINILRYQINQSLNNILFASTKYAILSFGKDQNFAYNIEQKNKFIIDSHQKINLENFNIQKYNETHFTIQQCDPDCQIQLYKLQNYNVPCLNTCDESMINILISNNVDQLNLTLENSISKGMQISQLQFNLQQSIIVITGVLIFCYLRKPKRNNKKN